MPGGAARRGWVICTLAGALALFTVSASPAVAAGAQSAATHVSVSPVHVWTDTRMALHSGDTLTIRTSGRIHFGAPPIDRLTAVGIPRGAECDAVAARRSAAATAWPAPHLSCWSLIGRIGSSSPFAIGGAHSIRATQDGELFLGVNDNFLGDNAGQWSVTVVATAAVAASDSGGAKHPSLLLLVAIALAVVLAAAFFFTWSRRSRRAPRRRAPRRRGPSPAGPRTVATAPAAEKTVRAPARRSRAGASAAVPVSGDDVFTEVNIFEVEFPDPTTLRVGYNHFHEGTVVAWRVTQDATLLASGEFVAEGGGSRYHFVTMPLGVSVESGSDGFVAADVSFSWSIGEVPFGYSVRREPVS